MLRLALYTRCAHGGKGDVKEFPRDCTVVAVTCRPCGKQALKEIWVSCRSVEGLAKCIEYLLDNGYFVEAVGTLSGEAYSVDKLTFTPGQLVDLASRDTLVSGHIELECVIDLRDDRVKHVMSSLLARARFATLRLKERTLRLYIDEDIQVSTFFDHGLRLLRPRRIPP